MGKATEGMRQAKTAVLHEFRTVPAVLARGSPLFRWRRPLASFPGSTLTRSGRDRATNDPHTVYFLSFAHGPPQRCIVLQLRLLAAIRGRGWFCEAGHFLYPSLRFFRCGEFYHF